MAETYKVPYELKNASVQIPRKVDHLVLGTDLAEIWTCPSGTNFAILSANQPFWVKTDYEELASTGVGAAFRNQTSNEAATVVSSDNNDTTQIVTPIGITNGTDTVVAQDVALNGTTPVDSAKTNWGVLLAVKGLGNLVVVPDRMAPFRGTIHGEPTMNRDGVREARVLPLKEAWEEGAAVPEAKYLLDHLVPEDFAAVMADFDRLISEQIELAIKSQPDLPPEEADAFRQRTHERLADPQAKSRQLQQIVLTRVLADEARRQGVHESEGVQAVHRRKPLALSRHGVVPAMRVAFAGHTLLFDVDHLARAGNVRYRPTTHPHDSVENPMIRTKLMTLPPPPT